MPSKLLFINSSLTGGGSERAMGHVASALAARGHDVTMCLVREKPQTYAVDSRVKVIQHRQNSATKVGKAVRRLRQLRREIHEGDFDYVISYMWDLNVTALIAAWRLNARVVVSERAYVHAATRSRLSRYLERLTYRSAHRVVFQTSQAQALSAGRWGDSSCVIPNIVEAADRPPLAFGQRESRIVSAGRLVPQKNFALLIRAFARVHTARPDWTLEIYGSGPQKTHLERLVSELGVTPAVELPGFVDDLSSKVARAGMFVLSSDFEGMPNVLAEAMALGLPVVSTDCPVGGPAALIEHNVNGLLVPVGDELALADAMLAMADADESVASMAQRAVDVTVRYSPDTVAKLWERTVLTHGQ